MPKTKAHSASKRKVSTSSKATELGDIVEEVVKDPQEGTKLNTYLEQFELEFAFRMKQYDQLLEEKLAVLNRAKAKMKIRYSTMLESTLDANNVMELIHDKENVTVSGVQRSSQRKCAQTENVTSSLQGSHGKRSNRISKQKNNEQPAAFQAPIISTGFPNVPGVMPKVAMNTPISMLRLPRQGEMALSLSGSPVMATAMSHEIKPNINIPLSGGKILTMIPHERLDPNSVPELDNEAVQQLQALNKNLMAFINMTSDNSVFK